MTALVEVSEEWWAKLMSTSLYRMEFPEPGGSATRARGGVGVWDRARTTPSAVIRRPLPRGDRGGDRAGTAPSVRDLPRPLPMGEAGGCVGAAGGAMAMSLSWDHFSKEGAAS